MHVPEQLFSLPLLKDVRTQPLEIVYRTVTGGIVGGQFVTTGATPLYIVPSDRILVISSFAVECTPDLGGGWPICVGLVVALTGESGRTVMAAAGAGANTGTNPNGVSQTYGATGSVWVPPNATLSASALFNVAGSHVCNFTFAGLTIPRGSVSIA